MAIKAKRNGAPMHQLTNEKLREMYTKGGKLRHKARMELIKRGLIDGQGKNLFDLVAESDRD